MDTDNVIPIGTRRDAAFCTEELNLLHQVAEFLVNPSSNVGDLNDWMQATYPYFVDCYRVARIMNPANPNPTRSALRASRHRAGRDRT